MVEDKMKQKLGKKVELKPPRLDAKVIRELRKEKGLTVGGFKKRFGIK